MTPAETWMKEMVAAALGIEVDDLDSVGLIRYTDHTDFSEVFVTDSGQKVVFGYEYIRTHAPPSDSTLEALTAIALAGREAFKRDSHS